MTETSEQRIERVARAIYESLYGKKSDEDWQKLRDFYLDPHTIRMGGQSMPFTAARAAESLLIKELLTDNEKVIEAMVREACDDLGYGLGDRWKGITTSADLDDIAYSMLRAIRRHHGVEP